MYIPIIEQHVYKYWNLNRFNYRFFEGMILRNTAIGESGRRSPCPGFSFQDQGDFNRA